MKHDCVSQAPCPPFKSTEHYGDVPELDSSAESGTQMTTSRDYAKHDTGIFEANREGTIRALWQTSMYRWGRGRRLKQLQGHRSSHDLILYVPNSCLGAVMSVSQLTEIHGSHIVHGQLMQNT